MAIIIPSAKTYDRQNPKVRDNVVERVEILAKEVVPANHFDESVFNKQEYVNEIIYDKAITDYKEGDGQYIHRDEDGDEIRIDAKLAAYYSISDGYTIFDVDIKKLTGNGVISSINYGNDKKSSEPNIKINLLVEYKISEIDGLVNRKSGKLNIKNEKIYSIGTFNSNTLKEFLTVEAGASADEGYINISKTIEDNSNISSITPDYSDYDFIKLRGLKILSGVKIIETGGETELSYLDDEEFSVGGEKRIYTTKSIEITIYGNTIGIDLNDKTVYINGETAKKVHSIDGNELMQTTNYILDENGTKTNAIDKMYGDTQKQYAKGKETATIRCSIGDYYDGSQKVIAIDNSTNKMCFEVGDEVIPMVYGANGQDRPMSFYSNNTQKVFQVLAVKPYYDGAVWQELTLQEKLQIVDNT